MLLFKAASILFYAITTNAAALALEWVSEVSEVSYDASIMHPAVHDHAIWMGNYTSMSEVSFNPVACGLSHAFPIKGSDICIIRF